MNKKVMIMLIVGVLISIICILKIKENNFYKNDIISNINSKNENMNNTKNGLNEDIDNNINLEIDIENLIKQFDGNFVLTSKIGIADMENIEENLKANYTLYHFFTDSYLEKDVAGGDWSNYGIITNYGKRYEEERISKLYVIFNKSKPLYAVDLDRKKVYYCYEQFFGDFYKTTGRNLSSIWITEIYPTKNNLNDIIQELNIAKTEFKEYSPKYDVDKKMIDKKIENIDKQVTSLMQMRTEVDSFIYAINNGTFQYNLTDCENNKSIEIVDETDYKKFIIEKFENVKNISFYQITDIWWVEDEKAENIFKNKFSNMNKLEYYLCQYNGKYIKGKVCIDKETKTIYYYNGNEILDFVDSNIFIKNIIYD